MFRALRAPQSVTIQIPRYSKHLRNLQLPLFFDFLCAWATNKLNKWTGPRMDEINNIDNTDNTDNTDHFRHVSSCSSCSSCSIVQMLQFSTCNSSCRTKTSCWICSARSCQGTLGITPSQHHHSLSDFPHLFSEWSSRKRIEECLEYSIDFSCPARIGEDRKLKQNTGEYSI